MADNQLENNERNNYVKEQIRYNKRVYFNRLPYENYLHCSYISKTNDIWEIRYKSFYNIPSEVDLLYEEE